uniref:SH2 domain-containing protein n=1 Tax=Strongyloides papillosus TaxID=174720 RepID=A0A0N5CDG3_STREA
MIAHAVSLLSYGGYGELLASTYILKACRIGSLEMVRPPIQISILSQLHPLSATARNMFYYDVKYKEGWACGKEMREGPYLRFLFSPTSTDEAVLHLHLFNSLAQQPYTAPFFHLNKQSGILA